MEAQKCKLCGARHHRYEPHVFVSGEALPSAIAEVTLTPPVKAGGDPSKFDRNAYHRAYMREYMRLRRAKAKEPQ
jgi:hypothetical protein